MKQQKKLVGHRNIIIVAWSGEELGLLGSSHFIKKLLPIEKSQIKAVINLDMIGHLQKKLLIQGVGSSQQWCELLENVAKTVNQPVELVMDPYLPTDSTTFYIHGIPAINLFSGAFPGYHTPQDTMDSINFEGIQQVCHFLTHLIFELEAYQKPIEYAVVKRKDYIIKGKFKVFLGTIPDYTCDENFGVRLSAVMSESPASLAGLKSQDIVIEFDDIPIHNLKDYTNLFYIIEPNRLYQIKIRRGHKILSLGIMPKSRT